VKINKIVIAGAGPAGMMAAIRSRQLSQDVSLIEKNPLPGKKLLLTGKGRCNLTNDCDLEDFISRFSANGAFLRNAFNKFFVKELMDFFTSRGLQLKVERQGRVFPVCDRSSSILDVLRKELEKNKVKTYYKTGLKDIVKENSQVKAVLLSDGKLIHTDKVILATGGLSYAFTGSTGEGIKLAQRLGHNIIACRPGLVPLEVKHECVRELEGLTLKNIRLKFFTAGKDIISEIGELMFTHNGISGPLVLTLSSRIVDWLAAKKPVFVEIDLKPALSPEQLEQRLLRDFKANPRKGLKHILKESLPLRLIDVFIRLGELDPEKKGNQITQGERFKIGRLLKALSFEIKGTLPLEEAMVTRGGVSLKEIDPRTMESRIIKGLYFCGEMIDLDADTGGFNLQAAFSTGYLAGESASQT